ncbi:MAG: DEAD/DEAH box helicase [Erysipelotrichia bacterium]|nr:DEAD/DEAH box helicase [Erysipelotrichia bacterium]
MKCLRCHNEDPFYFYCDQGTYYCRKCIMFGRIDVGAEVKKKKYRKKKHDVHYTLDYELTRYQKQAVKQLNAYLTKKQNVLVYAATGAGKTEIVMQSIENYLRASKKVGMAIARRQVVLEIKERMQKAFPTLKVVGVCEGHTRVVDGDLIICTMHQLCRYHQTFDLLIMDEVDAFPYYNNELLETIAMHSCVGEIVYLTATPDEKMKKATNDGRLQVVELFVRPHGKPLVMPKVRCMPSSLQLVYLYQFLRKQKSKHKQVLVFVPTIYLSQYLSKVFSLFFVAKAFSSQTGNKEEIIEAFRKQEYDCLFCTTVLERGITIKGVNVCVFHGDHIVFNEASLIQIFGRVGRSMEIFDGDALLLCAHQNQAIKQCLHTIQMMNQSKR